MKPAVSTLTISFEAPFWVGLYEREEEGLYQVCKIPFGAEPKDYEVYAFLQRHWKDLTFSPPLPAGHRAPDADQPQTAPAGDPKAAPGPCHRHQSPAGPAAAARPAGPDPEGDRPSKANPGPAPPGRPAPGETPGKTPGPLKRTSLRSLRLRRAVRRLPKRARARRGTEGVFQGEPICFERILKKRDGRHTQAACFFMVK